METVKVAWLYPDLLNLHGEKGSITGLMEAGKNLGINVDVVRVEDAGDPVPEDADLMILLPGEMKTVRFLADKLRDKKEFFREFVERNGYILAIGTTGLLFGGKVQREDGSEFEGLGLLELSAKERSYAWGDDLHCRIIRNKMELIGQQVSMMDVATDHPFAEVIYGRGNGFDGKSGCRYKNLCFIDTIGPLMVKNPWFAEDVLKDALLNRKLGVSFQGGHRLADNAMRQNLKFINEKHHVTEKEALVGMRHPGGEDQGTIIK